MATLIEKKRPLTRSEINKRWYARHPEKSKAASRSYFERNRKRVYERNRAWVNSNKEKKASIDRAYYLTHTKERQEYIRNYYRVNADKIKAAVSNYQKTHRAEMNLLNRARRLKIRTNGGSVTKKQIVDMYLAQGEKCNICSTPLNWKFDVDHIIAVSRGGRSDVSNLQILCPRCNREKYTKDNGEYRIYKTSEIQLLALTIADLARERMAA